MSLALTALLFTMESFSLVEVLEIPSLEFHFFGSRPLYLVKN